jgi:peroxiredoxin
MARTLSTMLELGTLAPDFSLPDTEGRLVKRDDFKGKAGLVVIFMCNHCPYVKHIQHALAKIADEYQNKGLAVVGISSNDVANYPDDSPEKMAAEAKKAGYTFPYLYDETQQAAKAYKAACTPDLFLFDQNQKLVYRGQFDNSRPGNDVPVTGQDLKAAMDAVLAGQPVPATQKPSMGCNIKSESCL